MLQGVVLRPQDAAEAARVAEAEARVFAENKISMIMLIRRGISGQDAQAAGHAEAQDHRAPVEIKDKIFGVPRKITQLPADQFSLERFRDRPAQAAIADDNVSDLFPDDMRCYAAADGLNFGQLRHENQPQATS